MASIIIWIALSIAATWSATNYLVTLWNAHQLYRNGAWNVPTEERYNLRLFMLGTCAILALGFLGLILKPTREVYITIHDADAQLTELPKGMRYNMDDDGYYNGWDGQARFTSARYVGGHNMDSLRPWWDGVGRFTPEPHPIKK